MCCSCSPTRRVCAARSTYSWFALFFVLVSDLLKLWVERRALRRSPRSRRRGCAAGDGDSSLLRLTKPSSQIILLQYRVAVCKRPVGHVSECRQHSSIARQYDREGQETSALHARRIARNLPAASVAGGDVDRLLNPARCGMA